jgi:hypothetical protein
MVNTIPKKMYKTINTSNNQSIGSSNNKKKVKLTCSMDGIAGNGGLLLVVVLGDDDDDDDNNNDDDDDDDENDVPSVLLRIDNCVHKSLV